jgi:hypothetical protein
VTANNVSQLKDEGILIDVGDAYMKNITKVVLNDYFYVLKEISCNESYVVKENYSISEDGTLIIIEPLDYIDLNPTDYCIAGVSTFIYQF